MLKGSVMYYAGKNILELEKSTKASAWRYKFADEFSQTIDF